jgi:hypothetical protein
MIGIRGVPREVKVAALVTSKGWVGDEREGKNNEREREAHHPSVCVCGQCDPDRTVPSG